MTVALHSPAEARAWSDDVRRDGLTVGLVATMGALHAGHRALIERARRAADRVVVSIFVNPLQFDRSADFEAYPRSIDDDLAECRRLGVDAVYAPTAAAMYPQGFETTVQPGALADTMEGAMRPGHFAGVTTVVAKLFAAVGPQVATFGEKDFQQLAIVRRMTIDLDLGVEILAVATVREPDGLALSSRNARLTDPQRAAARCVPAALTAAVERSAAGERDTATLEAAAADVITSTKQARLEYATVFDADTLARTPKVERSSRIAVAVWFGDVRLIDNTALTTNWP